MDFRAGLENVLQQEVTVIHGEETRKLCIANNKYLNGKDADTFRNLAVLLDHLGERSAKAQKLPKPVTSFIKFRNSDQSIFLLSDIPVKKFVILIYMFFRVLGFLKVGRKRLFVHDSKGVCVECIPLCILDFYIHESHQRKGYGKKLFDFMLKTENIQPSYLAIDLPSMKMIQFLHKHYHLINPIYSPNNFVVYSEFFNNLNNSNYSIVQSKLTTTNCFLKSNSSRIHQNKHNHSIVSNNNNNNNNNIIIIIIIQNITHHNNQLTIEQ
uniref:Alpha-tubulin N-acetyltransferase n=1 Tax=Schistosoma japonicum TaxID=6182 RepID=ATAT_SCHJA|nr:RecName: Full=Alpha-tubulin N-acetyltransferase; Short=Alpha-TAT; Short=TAT; AltName: Full=Acetyltransferase mec-17 homolog [Schistosoma japonicum]AAW26210.1 SJCHGC00609 protein [Schistosoma japonicum]